MNQAHGVCIVERFSMRTWLTQLRRLASPKSAVWAGWLGTRAAMVRMKSEGCVQENPPRSGRPVFLFYSGFR